jgi:hypothetical protein
MKGFRSKASSPDRLFRVEAEVVSRWLRHSLQRGEGWSQGEKEGENDGKE